MAVTGAPVAGMTSAAGGDVMGALRGPAELGCEVGNVHRTARLETQLACGLWGLAQLSMLVMVEGSWRMVTL